MNRLQQRWQEVQMLSAQIRTLSGDDPHLVSEAERLLLQRTQLLESLLNESALSTMEEADLQWLADAVAVLLNEDRALRSALESEQKSIHSRLKKEQSQARAAQAYRSQENS